MRTQSQPSQVAKLCKKYCTKLGIKSRAKSESYLMGDSVSITVYDQSPEIMVKLQAEFAQYQYGYSDSMDNTSQTKCLTISNEFSDELLQNAWAWARSHFEGADEYPTEFREISDNHEILELPAQMIIYRLLHGTVNGASNLYWASVSK